MLKNSVYKTFMTKYFHGYGKPRKLRNFQTSKIIQINEKIIIKCAYSHVQVQRNQDQPAAIDSPSRQTTATVVAGHGGFCNRYNNNQYAVGIHTGIAPRAKASVHHTQWQAHQQRYLRNWDLISWFRNQNTS